VELIVQPTDGIKLMLDTVAAAQKSIDIMIFRFDLKPMEKALEAAATRGVAIRALIARESSQGDKRLRQLEMRMLEKGILVARTGDAFVRYHGKMMVIDRDGGRSPFRSRHAAAGLRAAGRGWGLRRQSRNGARGARHVHQARKKAAAHL